MPISYSNGAPGTGHVEAMVVSWKRLQNSGMDELFAGDLIDLV